MVSVFNSLEFKCENRQKHRNILSNRISVPFFLFEKV